MKQCPTCGKTFEDSVKFCPDDASQLLVVGEERLSDPFIGVVLGTKYRIEEKIGEGGMGQIYMARHVTLKKRYAVKMLNTEFSKNQEAVERFRREATTAGELEHPNIIDVTDIDYTEDGRAYIVMEFLDGRELRDDLTATPVLPPERMVHIMTQVCRALDAAHGKGIVHRDLKPENIFLVDLPDQPDTVKLLDFGISKIKTGGATNLTQTGMVIGTPHYMAPEQAKGDRDIDHRADIYALGAMLYEATTGQVPATGETATAILMKILLEEPAPPSQVNPGIGPQLEAVISRAMAKDPDARFSSCGELAQALQAATGITMGTMTHSAVAAAAQAPINDYTQPHAAVAPATTHPTGTQPQQGYGTAQTPMTWTGGSTGTVEAAPPPKKKKRSAALIAIPLVLILVLVLGGGAAAALAFTGILSFGLLSGGSGGSKGPASSGQVLSKGSDSSGSDVATSGKKKGSSGKASTGKDDDDESSGKKGVAEEAEDGGDDDEGVAGEGKIKVKFTTDPAGADVILKVGAHERKLCTTSCMHEFTESDKKVIAILRLQGYRDEQLEFTPDFNKELITNLTKSKKGGGKKKGGGSQATVVKELGGGGSGDSKKPGWEIKKPDKGDGKKPKDDGGKKPIIKPIDTPKKPGSGGGKKPPAIKIISSPGS